MDKNVERLSDNIYGKKSKGATYETITPAMRADKKREEKVDNMLDQMAASIPSKKKGGRRSRRSRTRRSKSSRKKRSTRRRRR